MSAKTGILLINLGTPDSPDPQAVGRYLREFLMDPLVVDIPYVFRWFLVNALIVPRRSHASSLLYKKVWSDHGSPLLFFTRELEKKVAAQMGSQFVVCAGMRYGNPSLADALRCLKKANVDKIFAFPLYPQYSLAATESSIREVERVRKTLMPEIPVDYVPAFYNNPHYLNAVVEVTRPELQKRPFDKVLFSFHGLPERQVKKTDPTGAHCLARQDCCEELAGANVDCYRHHCFVTARKVAAELGLDPSQYEICFQSRLGRTPWIRPYTDEFYRTLPSQGVKRLAVVCPSFVADCLETLEEVQIRGKEEFVRNGGEDLFLVPSLNASSVWVSSVIRILHEKLAQGELPNQPSEHRPAGSPSEHTKPCH